jgi:hypothetical protein
MKKIFLVCFLVLSSFYGKCQDMYVYGNIKKADADYIKSLVKLINQKFKTKSLAIYYEKSAKFIYQPKDINAEVFLDAQLELMTTSSQIIRHTPKEINQIKMDIITETESKKRLIIFNNKGDNVPTKSYNDNSKLFDYINDGLNRKDKDFVFLLIFNKERPVISIKTPKENQKTSRSQIEGSASSSDTISQVLVRVNDKDWILANGISNWAIKTTLQSDNNFIEAIAIDKYNDTSEVFKISNVSYEPPKRAQWDINYIYPNESQNMAPKCQINDGYNYNFKISYEPSIKLSSIQLVIEGEDKKVIYSETLDQIAEESKREIPKNNNIELCLFLNYTMLGTTDVCSIDMRQNYYYYLRSSYGENITFPPKIKIHFQSFNQTPGSNDFCNCD